MAPQAVEFDETTATPLPGAQNSQSVTFDDSTAVPLPKAAPVQAQPAGPDGANQPFSPADRALYTRPVNPGVATPPPAQQAQPNPSLQAPPATPVAPADSGVPGIPQKHPANNPANPVYHPGENGVPNFAETPLAPIATKGSETVERALWPLGTADWDRRLAEGQKDVAAFNTRHPNVAGVTSGVQETVSGMTTPANLALIAAAPESKAVSAFFALQATHGAYQNAEQAYQAWRSGNNPQAAKYLTESGLSAIIAGLAGTHAADPRITTGPYGAKGVRVGGDTFGAEVGTTPAYRQPGPTGSYAPDEGSTVIPRQTTAGARVGPVAVGSMRTPGVPAPSVEIPPAAPALPAPTPGPVIEGEGVPIPPVRQAAAPEVLPPQTPIPPNAKLATAEAALTGKPIEGVAPPAPTIQPTPNAARPPVQASTQPAEIRESAQDQKTDLKQMATAVTQAVPGAEVVGPRVKSADSIDNKDERGKPVETNIDNLGVRVVAPNPDAVPEVQKAVENVLPVASKDTIENNGLNIPQYGVKTGGPGEPNQVSELQVVPSPEVADAMKETDPLYAKQKEAIARGDKAEADRLGTEIQAKFDAARSQIQPSSAETGGRAQSPEQAVGAGKPAPAAITKGSQVTLPDGTNGAVQHVNPNYSSGGRVVVQTPNGVKTFKGSELKPVENAPGPVGAPIPARVAQIKEVAAKGTPVKIFTARGADPEVKQWLQQQGLGNLPVTNVKGHDFGALLDNEVNVPTNSDKPFEMPAVPAGKALYVDLDGTIARQPGASNQVEKGEAPSESKGVVADEQRNSTEQPANSVTKTSQPKEGEESHADEITGPAPRAVGERPESGAAVRGRHAEGGEAAGAVTPAGEKPGGEENAPKEKVEPTKHKFGNTQADIPPASEAGKALARARKAILPEDLAGEGMIDDAHITVRYGIDGEDTAGIRAYLEKQPPFEATLGKTQAFPPSEHSDGAAPIVVPVESADLRRMEKELDKHGNFTERSFPEYKPHVTLAYVKPGEAKRYTGMTEADGKKFKVESVSISKKDGTVEEVKLKGTAKPQFSAAARAKVMDRPARTDQIGKPGVEVPAKYEPKPNESSTVATAPKKPESLTERFKRAQQAKADKYLDTQVRRADNSIATRRAIIDERMAGGGTTSVKQVQDDAAERKLDREIGAMRRAGMPTGNEMHPTTIKYRGLLAQQKEGIKVPSYRITDKDGETYIVSKTEYDYAQSIEGKATPKEKPSGGQATKNPEVPPSSIGTKLYSGFGDPELFKQLFPDVTQRIADWIKDPSGPGVDQKAMMRETRGQMDRRVAIAIHSLRKEQKAWRTRSREDSTSFINGVQRGQISSLQPKDRPFAQVSRTAFEQMREEIQALKPEALRTYIENYWPQEWEQASQVTATIRRLLNGKRPFAGKAEFLKKRTIPTFQDGLDLGFKPKTWNPVDQFLVKYASMAQFLMGHQTLQMMKDAGTAKYVRLGKKAPDG